MPIRNATEADAASIAGIYNHAVQHTTAIWNDQVVDVPNRVVWLHDRQAAGFPVLVMQSADGKVTGYASYGPWRAFDGYRHTVEHSVYVHPDHHRKGIGQELMSALIEEAKRQGLHIMVAGIEAGNAGSIVLHRRLGFEDTGTMQQVGCKFGRWLDLTFMTLRLDARPNP
ncbi:GNAT family N-acetyltransferase [Acetobacter indonesiensis]|uniref:GNAT family N-acetyltransferase n=1 Tax=Acetobacter indonesiensis TaxID=104101 RepID=UPI0020A4F95F|nr:GNAT family N-acetyltransferase [Acetobacter indonesiensis]MCP1230148.1 GNAT family N-acetyltransferase [Acetobacter indonesiensis]